MPIYTYQCNECGFKFEQNQRMSDDPLTQCPQCEGVIRRVINSVGVVFKGSGFYVTDNRNGKSGAPVKPSKESGANSESSTSGESSATSDSGSTSSSGDSGSKSGAETTPSKSSDTAKPAQTEKAASATTN